MRKITVVNNSRIIVLLVRIALLTFFSDVVAYELGFAAGYYRPALSDEDVVALGMTGSENVEKKNLSEPDIVTYNITASNLFSGVYSLNVIIGYFQLERTLNIEGIMSREESIRIPSVEIFT